MPNREMRPTITIPGTSSHTIGPRGSQHSQEGTLRYLKAGSGAPLVLLHTVRTQAEHFRFLIPLISDHYTVYALDLPGMGYSEIVPGASYQEPEMRAGVERLLTELDLHDVTLVGESMGAVLALTTAADLPERVRRVVAVNAYDYRDGIARSSVLARMVIGGVLAPGVGSVIAGVEPKAILRRVLQGGLVDKTALPADYVDELLQVGSRPGYPAVARAVYQNMPSLMAARSRYSDVKAPIHLVYGEKDWSRRSDRDANKALLPAADFTELRGVGHFIALEKPETVADLLASSATSGASVVEQESATELLRASEGRGRAGWASRAFRAFLDNTLRRARSTRCDQLTELQAKLLSS
ncbi:alpha/beta fold hydrolase [Rhodococcus tibetensis]|uniref:Alpha/beta hydrolase n=1 Tax=Rhodococcus tibetensis TaxID=2965064 RepID=A0ABT1QCS5_9NOCA|nr:alpha/beta hydrolase [Rhodococcus sp. FXJ9.536]MCQ4120066.1 alpha/beta hydrolase [Rhodococcus sp. FXJ9.536]